MAIINIAGCLEANSQKSARTSIEMLYPLAGFVGFLRLWADQFITRHSSLLYAAQSQRDGVSVAGRNQDDQQNAGQIPHCFYLAILFHGRSLLGLLVAICFYCPLTISHLRKSSLRIDRSWLKPYLMIFAWDMRPLWSDGIPKWNYGVTRQHMIDRETQFASR